MARPELTLRQLSSNDMRLYTLIGTTSSMLGFIAMAACATRDSGYRITKETTAFVQPGVTTRADLIENMGPPLLELKDPHVLAYSWGKVHPKAVARAPGQDPSMAPGGAANQAGYSAGPSPLEETGSVETERWVYCVALDDHDRVTRSETVKLEQAPSLEIAVRRWANAHPSSP